MSDDVATDAGRDRRAELRRRRLVLAGHRGDRAPWPGAASAIPIRACRRPPSARSARLGELTTDDVVAALAAGAAPLRRRAVEAAPGVHGRGSRSVLPAAVTGALADPDPLVVVGAAWFLGERRHRPAVAALAATATEHADTRCREAAVAALGAIGDPDRAARRARRARRQADGPAAGDGGAGRLRRPEGGARPAGGRRGPRLAGAPGRRGAARSSPSAESVPR